MALIAIASDKGSPGVTTAALALAAVWPRRTIFAELDPFGGDITLRLRGPRGALLSPDRGALSLSDAAQPSTRPEQVFEHVQRLDGGLEVLVGPPSAEYAARLRTSADQVGRLLNNIPGVDVVADCGRLYPETPILNVLHNASALVLVTRPSIDGVAHLRLRANWLVRVLTSGTTSVPMFAVVVTKPRDERSAQEIDHVLRQANVPVHVIGRIADDPEGAGMLTGEWHGRLDKSLLVRSVRDIAVQLSQSVAELERN